MRHAGIHWPSNANGEHPSVDAILSMPGIREGCCLITAESARYWYRSLRAASPLVVWRAIPRVGKLPAQLGWEPNKVADECLNLWNEQPHAGSEWFLPLNELQFEKEAGAAFPGYTRMAEHLAQVRLQLRRKFTQQYPGAEVRLMFPAWVPGDDLEHADEWISEARQWEGVCLHAYGSAGEIGAICRSSSASGTPTTPAPTSGPRCWYSKPSRRPIRTSSGPLTTSGRRTTRASRIFRSGATPTATPSSGARPSPSSQPPSRRPRRRHQWSRRCQTSRSPWTTPATSGHRRSKT
jgi:hypothetical protein